MKLQKRLLLLSLFIIFCCSDSNHKEISVETTVRFEASETKGILKKSKLIDKNSIGFYQSGNQKFFIDLLKKDQDSVIFPDRESLVKKTERGVDFYYKDKELIIARKKRNDSVYVYNPNDLDNPSSIQVFDSNKNIIKEVNYISKEQTIYLHKKIDVHGNPIYTEIHIKYLPSKYETEYKSEIELKKLKLENQKFFIEQKEYTYY